MDQEKPYEGNVDQRHLTHEQMNGPVAGYQFSSLSLEDVKAIKDVEQKINKNHALKLYLIAYDKLN